MQNTATLFTMMPCLCRRCTIVVLSVQSMEQQLTPLACESMLASHSCHHALLDIILCIQSCRANRRVKSYGHSASLKLWWCSAEGTEQGHGAAGIRRRSAGGCDRGGRLGQGLRYARQRHDPQAGMSLRHTQIHPFYPQTPQVHIAVGPGSESLRGKAVFVSCCFFGLRQMHSTILETGE